MDNGDKEGHIKDYSISSCWMPYRWYIDRCAPYKLGDILYVRETWQYLYELDGNDRIIEGTGRYYYAATDELPFDAYVDPAGIGHQSVPWRPSIHMPKEAARIWLKVTDVRVERLQDMDTEDGRNYIAEGARDKQDFIRIWDATAKDRERYSWDANPWVWVIEFEQCEKPDPCTIRERRKNSHG